MQAENSSVVGGGEGDSDSEDDFDWEEVVMPQTDGTPADSDVQEGPSEPRGIEITLKTHRAQAPLKKNARGEQLYAARVARLNAHKIHTVFLLANARTRNKWINDPLLHARLMSLTPLTLQNAFAAIHKSRHPEAVMRGQLFEAAVTGLARWWGTVFAVAQTGHIRNRTFDEVQKVLAPDPKGKARATDDDAFEDDDEVIRSEKSLMKHALMHRGSRDTSAQLFTALCRALGIPARLVVSLQSVPWQASVGKPKPTAKKKSKKTPSTSDKGKGKATAKADGSEEEDEDDMEMEEVEIPGSSQAATSDKEKGKAKANDAFPGGGQRLDGGDPSVASGAKGKQKAPPVIKLRQNRGRKLGTTAADRPPLRARTPDPTETPPVFWTEVFSRADARWIPVDPIRCIVNKRKAFDPGPGPTRKPDRSRPYKVENRMVYVVAFEEDGFARDVTPRYAREYGAKVAKVQQGGKGKKEWWERIMGMVTRPFRLHRDDLEDEELQTNQLTEAMPTSMSGFKDHPLYALARHLKRDEVIHPPVELGKFRGEAVYPRSSVIALKTAENWMRQGRKVKEGYQPMKWVKQRAVTVAKKRAIEMALTDRKQKPLAGAGTGDTDADAGGHSGADGVMQGLYAVNQTEVYQPPPVVNGKVPKNDFGNIDLYVPSMLPRGAAYLPFKGTAKIARQLGFDFAEAVTGFEFKKRRAFPVIAGIVVAAENEAAVLEAYWEAEQEARKKRDAKRKEQVIKRWAKLVHGLRIRQRLVEQYAERGQGAASVPDAPEEDAHGPQLQEEGGFLTGADDVVQPYTLPRNFHEVLPTPATLSLAAGEAGRGGDASAEVVVVDTAAVSIMNGQEDDHDMEEVLPMPLESSTAAVPRTMRELAEEAANQASAHAADEAKPAQTNGESTAASTPRTRAAAGPPAKQARGAASARRTRKRTRGDGDDAGDASDTAAAASSSRSSPAKRARAAPAPAVPAPTRVLRTRTPKSVSKMQEEKEMEEAYRRAVSG